MEEELKHNCGVCAPPTPQKSKSKSNSNSKSAGNSEHDFVKINDDNKVCLESEKSSNVQKKRANTSETPKKRKRMKRHRPKIFDETKFMKWNVCKPLTPKQKTPQRRTTQLEKRKSKLKESVNQSKDVDQATTSGSIGHDKTSCNKKLDFDSENNITLSVSELAEMLLPTEKQRRLAIDDPLSFKCVLNLRPLAKIRKNRSQRHDLLTLFSIVRRKRSNNPTRCRRKFPLVNREANKTETYVQVQNDGNGDGIEKEDLMEGLDLASNHLLSSNEITVQAKDESNGNALAKDLIKEPKLATDNYLHGEEIIQKQKCIPCFVPDNVSSRRRIMNTSPEKFVLKLNARSVPPDLDKDNVLSNRDVKSGDNVSSRRRIIKKRHANNSSKLIPRSVPPDLEKDNVLSSRDGKSGDNVSSPLRIIKTPHAKNSSKFIPHSVSPNLEKDYVLSSRDDVADVEALIDFAIRKFACLYIGEKSSQIVVQDEKGHGALVPFKGTVKKRKQWPKVHLDAETTRVWNPLMGNSNGNENMEDENDKAEYWKKEIEIFRKRMEWFIGVMNLVQGNRRFVKWKGSKVDSIAGVFLTQNVSDHLSSSAYMLLRARYPALLVNTNSNQESTERAPLVNTNSSQASTESVVVVNTNSSQESTESAPLVNTNSSQESTESAPLVNTNSSQESTESAPLVNTNSSQESTESAPLINTNSSQESTKSAPLINTNSSQETTERAMLVNTNSSQESTKSTEQSANIVNEQYRFFVTEEVTFKDKTKFVKSQIEDTVIVEDETMEKSQESVMLGKCPSCSFNTQVGIEPDNGKYSPSQSVRITGRKYRKEKGKQEKEEDWDELRKTHKMNQTTDATDSVNWEAVRQAPVEELAKVIESRGMNNIIAGRIKDFLDRIVKDHGSIDLEWLSKVPPDKTKDYLLSITGLGLKSVECVRLLALHQHAFPVDTNVGRILVRLGWVPLQPLPEDVQFHLLNQYPNLDAIQKYVWPRLAVHDVPTLYEFHYQMITAGKVFCTKVRPNCNACPLRGQCKYFASVLASSKFHLQASRGGKNEESSAAHNEGPEIKITPQVVPDSNFSEIGDESQGCDPVIEMPPSPEPIIEMPSSPELGTSEIQFLERDIEDFGCESEDGIPIIKINLEKLDQNVQTIMESTGSSQGENNMSKALWSSMESTSSSHRENDLSKELVVSSDPMTTQTHGDKKRSMSYVYELPDSHPLLAGFEKREPDDCSPYLLQIWITDDPKTSSSKSRKLNDWQKATSCETGACGSENCVRCQSEKLIQGTILIPCRSANRGSFPLNGTYFQVNEVFADHVTSKHPIPVIRDTIWNLRKWLLCCGNSVTSIFKGMSTRGIQYCFWKGFICVRGFDRASREPKMLSRRFHIHTSAPIVDDN